MAKVYVYKSGTVYRVSPPVVGLRGGQKLRMFNATDVEMTATFPKGSVDASKPVAKKIKANGSAKVEVRSQGQVTAYSYTVAPPEGAKAKGNSDPVLIIEN